jgi:hypothetical protein
MCLSIYLFVFWGVFLFICLSTYLFFHLSIYCLSVYPFFFLPISNPFAYLLSHCPVYLSAAYSHTAHPTCKRKVRKSTFRKHACRLQWRGYKIQWPEKDSQLRIARAQVDLARTYLCLSMSIFVYLCLSMSVYLSLSISITITISISISIYRCLSLSTYISISFSISVSACPHQAWSNAARLPQFSKLTTSKTKQFCETSPIFKVDNVQNEASLRDVPNLRSWQHQKRSNCVRLPSKMESWVQSW